MILTKKLSFPSVLLMALSLLISFSGCNATDQEVEEGKIQVWATTTIVGDIVKQVGGDLVDLKILIPPGSNPHAYSPTPQELAKLSEADILFTNGAGLETFLDVYLENTKDELRVVVASDGAELIPSEEDDHHDAYDPHMWMDPGNVMIWVDNITRALSELDPKNAESYQVNSSNYIRELEELDSWINEQINQIPTDNRKIVSDHNFLSYFTRRYGFIQVGAVIPGTSTLSEPSAQEMAELEDLIRNEDIRAIFVDDTVNPTLSERVAKDTGAKIVLLHSGSLSGPGGDVGSYLDYMRSNVLSIVDALK